MEMTNFLEYSDRTQLRSWLMANHEEEALCFGWIDSTYKRLPDGRGAQRLSPRRKNSHWTETNIRRCAELEQRGLMTDAGRALIVDS